MMGIDEKNLVSRWISAYKSSNDNRNYKYDLKSYAIRDEYRLISQWVKKGSKVIDLGCGEGSLLKFLKTEKKVKGVGIEISKSGVEACKLKGINVIRGSIDQKTKFKNKEFDYAICNVTLQMVMYPEKLILEMKRISKRQIFTFPNFAFFPNRIDLLLNGKMPRIMIPGYKWYSTGHIHQLSINDFIDFCNQNKMKILGNKHVYPGYRYQVIRYITINSKWMKKFPNLFASMAVFLTK